MSIETFILTGNKDSDIFCEGHNDGNVVIKIETSKNCNASNINIAAEFARQARIHKKTDTPIILEHGLLTESKIPTLFCIPKADHKLPVIFLVHGAYSNKTNQIGNGIVLAEQGFLTVLVDMRLHGERRPDDYDDKMSAGKVGNIFFNIIKETSDDIISLIDYIQNDPRVDSSRIGMTGFSMGGFITFLTIQRDKRIGAAAPIAGCPDWNVMKTRPDFHSITEETESFIIRYNPINNYQSFFPTPLLVQNGDADDQVPITGSRNLGAIIKESYSEMPERYKFYEYPGLPHEVDPLMMVRLIDWFKKYLQE